MTTPKANVLRTVLQAIVAVCIAIPTALAVVPIPAKYQGYVALVIGIAGAVVVLVTAVQNVIEARAGVALFRNPTAAAGAVAPGPLNEPNDAARIDPAQPRGPP